MGCCMPSLSSYQRGFLYLVVAVLLLSSKGIFVKFLYRYSVTPEQLLLVRILFSLPVYLWVLASIYPQEKHSLNAAIVVKSVFFGVCGYYLASWFDFWGLALLPVSLERLILFSYPGLVVLFAAVFLKQKMTYTLMLWLLVTYVGLVIVFAEDLLNHSIETREQLLGAGLVFLAAICFAIYMLGNEMVQKYISSRMFTCVSMIGATACIMIHYSSLFLWQDLWLIPWQAYAWMLLIALGSTILPTFLVAAGIREIGASVAGIVGGLGPIMTLILAYIFLGERLTAIQLAGFALVIWAVFQLQRSYKASA